MISSEKEAGIEHFTGGCKQRAKEGGLCEAAPDGLKTKDMKLLIYLICHIFVSYAL